MCGGVLEIGLHGQSVCLSARTWPSYARIISVCLDGTIGCRITEFYNKDVDISVHRSIPYSQVLPFLFLPYKFSPNFCYFYHTYKSVLFLLDRHFLDFDVQVTSSLTFILQSADTSEQRIGNIEIILIGD